MLDWDVARLRDDSETAAGQAPSESVTTQVGAIVGTPGYMAPEQAMGDPARIGPRSDVYALGAIPFELLTLKPLHEAANASGLISSTLRGVNAGTGARAPEALVPPELEAICVDATALRSGDRIASAKQLSDRVERYLEGDRDEQRRRALSEELVEQARQEMARAAAHGDGTDFTARKLALRTVARALALNPDNALAQRALLDGGRAGVGAPSCCRRGNRRRRRKALEQPDSSRAKGLSRDTSALGLEHRKCGVSSRAKAHDTPEVAESSRRHFRCGTRGGGLARHSGQDFSSQCLPARRGVSDHKGGRPG